jgi:hypothetical protein
LPPSTIIKVPRDCLAKPALKRFLSTPAKFSFYLGGIDRITPVMARAILHEAYKAAARSTLSWLQTIEEIADRRYNLEVGVLIPAAYIVGMTDAPSCEH